MTLPMAILYLLAFLVVTQAESETLEHRDNITALVAESSAPYCFRFTWIGPYSNPALIRNEQCPGYNNIPCFNPIVATDNNNVPDAHKLWRDNGSNPSSFGCMLKNGYSCIKWTYFFKNEIQNITYYCAKVNASNGCYREKDLTGIETEVCVCQSKAGQTPCNSGNNIAIDWILTVLMVLISMTVTLVL